MQLIQLLVGLIVPNPENPAHRSVADPLLTASVKKDGILDPLLVRKKGEAFELLDGHRRLAAAKAAGLTTVPGLLVEGDLSAQEMRLLTDLHKKELSSPEKVHAWLALKRLHPDSTVKDLAARLSIDPSLGSIYASYENCIPDAQGAFDAGKLKLKAMYAISRQELGEQRDLLEMSLTCSGEEIVRKARKRVNGSAGTNGIRVNRMKLPVPGTKVTVTIAGEGLSLDDGIGAVNELLKHLREGAKQNLDGKTLERVLRDRCKAVGNG